MKGKLIVIEGTTSSGKQTLSKMLTKSLNDNNIKCEKKSFPDYDSPTGKIIENCLLGKSNESLFKEGVNNIPPKVAGLYYAADRAYNKHKIDDFIWNGDNVILDRYVY